MTCRGHFSATESEDKGSSTGTTPKESQRKLVFRFTTRTKPRLATFLVHRGRITLTGRKKNTERRNFLTHLPEIVGEREKGNPNFTEISLKFAVRKMKYTS